MEAAKEEEAYLPFGPTDKPVASFGYLPSGDDSTNSSGLLGGFSGVTDEETDSLEIMVERGPVQGLWLRENVNGVLVAMIRGLVMLAMIHYMWLLFGSSFCTRIVVSTTSTDQLEIGGDITSAEGCLLLKASPATGPFNGDSNDSVTVLADSGLLGLYFDDAKFPRLRGDLDNY